MNINEWILYEDQHIIVCRKEAGVAVQTARMSQMDMESALKNYLAVKDSGKMPYLAIIHRLDQPVSGLLVFAKNQRAASVLSKEVQDGTANKDYIAYCSGILENKSGKLLHYIMKDPVTKLAKAIDDEAFIKIQEENNEESKNYKKAILSNPSEEKEIEIKDGIIKIPSITDGTFVILK